MLDKNGVYRFLKDKGVTYKALEHAPVFTVQEANALKLPHPEAGAKNLFLRNDKKSRYYLLTMRDDLCVDLKQIQKQLQTRRLSFASENDLLSIMGLTRGAVTPFGVLNDEARRVDVYLDEYFARRTISVHPNDNTATVYLAGEKLAELLREHGNRVEFINFACENND